MALIRRRRARKWDDEVSAAAAEAANSRMPVFLDDPDSDNNNRYGPNDAAPSNYHYQGGSAAHGQTGYNNVGNYSDGSSHGTYGQPAMSNEGTYPEMSGPAPGGIFDHNAAYAGLAGAAGIGVARARSRGAETMASAGTRNTGPSYHNEHGAGMDPNAGYAAGLGEGTSPYPAFLSPGHGYDIYNNAASQGYGHEQGHVPSSGSPPPDSRATHANAMASVAAAAAAGSTPAPLGRSNTGMTQSSAPHSGESYASHYEPGASPNRPDAASRSLDPNNRPSDEDESRRISQQEGLPNPFSSRIESEDESDEEEDVPGRRVLKVANE